MREDGGPLRGEQQEKAPSISSEKAGRGPVADSPVRVVDSAGQGRQQRGRVPLPPEDLRAVLAPVGLVWARLERPVARRFWIRSRCPVCEAKAGQDCTDPGAPGGPARARS